MPYLAAVYFDEAEVVDEALKDFIAKTVVILENLAHYQNQQEGSDKKEKLQGA